jgi:hypothetical protein
LNRPSTITNPRVRILPSSGIILSILSTPPSAAIPELSQVRPDLVRRTILVFVLPSLFPIPVAPAAVPPLEPGTTVLGTDTYKALTRSVYASRYFLHTFFPSSLSFSTSTAVTYSNNSTFFPPASPTRTQIFSRYLSC